MVTSWNEQDSRARMWFLSSVKEYLCILYLIRQD